MNKIKHTMAVLTAFVLMAIAPSAFANPVLAIATDKFGMAGVLVITTGIVVGAFVVIQGMLHFKKSAHDRLRYPISEGISTLLTGVGMLGFTFIYAVIRGSFYAQDNHWDDTSAMGGLAISNTIQEANDVSNSFMAQVLGNDMLGFIFGIMWLMGLILFFMGLYNFKLAGAPEAKNGGYVKRALTLLFISFVLLNPKMTSCTFLSVMPGENAAMYCEAN